MPLGGNGNALVGGMVRAARVVCRKRRVMDTHGGPWGDRRRDGSATGPAHDRSAESAAGGHGNIVTGPAPLDATVATTPMSRQHGKPSLLRRWLGRLVLLLLVLAAALAAQIIVYRFAMPAWTPTMAASRLLGQPVTQYWVPLRRVSPSMVRAVIASEDAKFCTHRGIDYGELKAAIEEALNGTAPRGASTITMQVVKNVLLWPGRSYVRKALELPLALALELVWSKRRIMEVYLNIAEWGPGIYGIEAAARQSFGKPAAALTAPEAARLVVVLPNPIERDPSDLEPRSERVAEIIEARARRAVNTGCLD